MQGTIKALFFSFLAFTSFAQAPKYSNEFLNIGINARAFAMGSSFVANASDVTSAYWNPAGLTALGNDFQASFMHSNYFANIAKYDYFGVAKKIDAVSTGAISIIRFGVDDIPNTTQLIDADGNIDYNRISTFSAVDWGFLFSYARKLKIEGLSVGGNVKLVHRKVGDFGKSWGFGIDAAITYVKNKWRFAAVGRDITTTFNAWSYTIDDATEDAFIRTGNTIPTSSIEITLPRLILAAAYTTDLGKKFSITGETNLVVTTDGIRNVLIAANPFSIDPTIGIEAGFKKKVYLRTGINNIQRITDIDGQKNLLVQPNMGVGIVTKRFNLDYAFTNLGNVNAALVSHVFSIIVKFDKNNGGS